MEIGNKIKTIARYIYYVAGVSFIIKHLCYYGFYNFGDNLDLLILGFLLILIGVFLKNDE